MEIWTHKSRIDNPLLCADDGPVYQLRRWYEQFYTDVEDITPDMVARYEFEVDTTRAVEPWEAEVAANLAARQEPADHADRQLATGRRATAGFRPVACDRCGAAVLVASSARSTPACSGARRRCGRAPSSPPGWPRASRPP